jgi:hypothetical protein
VRPKRSFADIAAGAQQARRQRSIARAAEFYTRNLICIECGVLVAVFEAAHGATREAEHQFTDRAEFVCLECLRPSTGGEGDGDLRGVS